MKEDPLPKRLKLVAEDVDDLTVIASCLQDAVVLVGDMAYQKKQRRFAFMASRFMWEAEAAGTPSEELGARDWRVRCGVHFDGVMAVRTRKIPAKRKTWPLDLLTIDCEEKEEGAATLGLIFANDAQVQLDVECIDCHLQDIGEPYLAVARPRHETPSSA